MNDFTYCTIKLGPQASKLSGQQKATVLLLSLGMSNKEIGEAVHRSPETVAKYVDALRIVFNVSTRAAIVGQAFCHGVLAPAGGITCALIFSIFLSQPLSSAASGSQNTPVGEGIAMTSIEKQFHRAQARLKHQITPAFSVELAGDNAPSASDRLKQYVQKRARVNRGSFVDAGQVSA
ncbi:MAG: response regulator transcription factor [Marinobacter sp.]